MIIENFKPFTGHYVAMYGYDDQFAYLIDTDQQGGRVKTTLKNLKLARNEKVAMGILKEACA